MELLEVYTLNAGSALLVYSYGLCKGLDKQTSQELDSRVFLLNEKCILIRVLGSRTHIYYYGKT